MKSARAHPHEKPHHQHWPLSCMLFGFVLLLGAYSVHEASTWLHIQTGARILAEHAIPRADTFSFTFTGRPWTTDSWLADVIFSHLHHSGPWALIALKAAAFAFAFTLLLPVNPSNPLVAAGVLGLGAVASWTGFTETPAFFDVLMLALLIRALRPRSSFQWAMAAQVALIHVLWSNLHASTAVLGVWVTGLKTFKAGLREEHHRDSLRHGALLLAAIAGFMLNPHGLQAVPQMFSQASSALAGWQSVSPVFNLYTLFVVCGLAACWITLQQEFFLTMTAATLLLLSLIVPSARPLYMLAVCPVITLALGHYIHPLRDTYPRLGRWALLMAALFALHYSRVYVPLGRMRGYATESVEGVLYFLDSNGVRGRMFNEPQAGEALIGGGRSVFVDTRAGLYGPAFMKDALHWSRQWRQLRDVYGFDSAVVLNHRAGYPARVLDEDPEWRLAYGDDTALLYLRKTGTSGWIVASATKRLVEPNRLWPESLDAALSQPKTRPLVLGELDRWIVQSPDSVQALLWKAYALDMLKLPQKAERLIAVAQSRSRTSWDPELLACLGFVLERRGQSAPALSAYEQAARFARQAGLAALEAEVLPRLAGVLETQGAAPRAARLRERAAGLSAAAAD